MPRTDLGHVAAAAWEAAIADDERRLRDRVTELHRWERRRNHRWVDVGWKRCPSRPQTWLWEQLAGRSLNENLRFS